MDEEFSCPIPSEFTDEDRWFKFFTKKQLAVVLLNIVWTIALGKLFKLFGIMPVGIAIGVIQTLVVTALAMFRLPESNYLRGGGQIIGVVLLKRMYRRLFACIYVKGYVEQRKGVRNAANR